MTASSATLLHVGNAAKWNEILQQYAAETLKETSDDLESKLGTIKCAETFDDPASFETMNVYCRSLEC